MSQRQALLFSPEKKTRLGKLNAQVDRFRQRLDQLHLRDRRMTRWRQWTILFGLLAAMGALAVRPAMGWAVLALVLAGFGSLVFFHRRLARGVRRHQAWLEVKLDHRARIELDWDRLDETGERVDPHAFASDLGLVGAKSIHQLLNTARSVGGGRRLQAWLLTAHPSSAPILKRQQLVRSLALHNRFRDRLQLHARLAQNRLAAPWDGERLMAWLEGQTPATPSDKVFWALVVLAGVNVSLFTLSQLTPLPAFWLISFVLYAGVTLMNQGHVGALLRDASALEQVLGQFATGFAYVEAEGATAGSELEALLKPFRHREQIPSRQLKRVARISAAASIRGNPLIWLLFNVVVPWDLYFLRSLERCKAALADRLPQWLDAWYELESLCSLATFADLNPNYVYPELLDGDRETACLEATALGHPLIPEPQKVCNDFDMASLGSVWLITGSNMSGKSTFLRTVGINLCLAYAGGPVDARWFRTRLFRLFTCIQVSDSLADGVSYFYAEVRRLRQLLDELQREDPLPLLYLIDEIFRGTNNRERLWGSQAYVRALVRQHGTGLISTHDLELVGLARDFPEIENHHFRESIEEGRMHFDYLLRPGPCPTTNALRIMQLEGLPVEFPAQDEPD